MLVTSELLRTRGACDKQVARFAREWPEGVKTSSKAGFLRASEIGLDLMWFAQSFLKAPLREEYDRQMALIREEDDRQTAPLWEEFNRQTALLLWSLFEKQEKKP